MTTHRAVRPYMTAAASELHRYRSWEHCYRYFRRHRHSGPAAERNDAALQLGFYLASWGTCRGACSSTRTPFTAPWSRWSRGRSSSRCGGWTSVQNQTTNASFLWTRSQ